MAIIFQDTFTESSDTILGSHTPDTGTSWTNIFQKLGSETLKVNSTDDTCVRETGSTSGGVLYTADVTYSTADYEVYATIESVETTDDYHLILARVQDSNNMYAVEFHEDRFRILKCVSGSWSILDNADAANILVNGDVVKLKVEGTSIKAYINDVEKADATDSDITSAGKAGYGMGNVATNGGDMDTQEIDNFNVNTLGAAAARRIFITT